jgi:hypothetical protein
MSTFNPSSVGPALDATIDALNGGLSDVTPATIQLNSWLRILNGEGQLAQGAILTEMDNLKTYIGRNDIANISHSLHALGKLTTKAADAEADVNEEISSKLRRLSEALLNAATAVA